MKTSKRVVTLLVMCMIMCSVVLFSMSSAVYAENSLEDNVSDQTTATTAGSGDFFDSLKDQDIGEAEGIGDLLGNHQTMTSEQLGEASKWTAPITNIIGYAMGVIIIITITLVGLITALDLLYIAVPPVRNLLYKAGTDGTGAYTGGMPAGGMGMGGFGRRGMGMGMGAMGAGGASGGTARPHQWVSDEAVACAALLGGSQQAVNMGMGGGMGMGMGGMGMSPMGMGGMQQPDQAPMRMKSVLWVYIKKRAVFLVLLMVAVMVLTSSALMGTGVNLAQWVLRIIGLLNGKIG